MNLPDKRQAGAGLETYYLASHLRFRVCGREADLDDLYVGEDEQGGHHAIAVEGKGRVRHSIGTN